MRRGGWSPVRPFPPIFFFSRFVRELRGFTPLMFHLPGGTFYLSSWTLCPSFGSTEGDRDPLCPSLDPRSSNSRRVTYRAPTRGRVRKVLPSSCGYVFCVIRPDLDSGPPSVSTVCPVPPTVPFKWVTINSFPSIPTLSLCR